MPQRPPSDSPTAHDFKVYAETIECEAEPWVNVRVLPVADGAWCLMLSSQRGGEEIIPAPAGSTFDAVHRQFLAALSALCAPVARPR